MYLNLLLKKIFSLIPLHWNRTIHATFLLLNRLTLVSMTIVSISYVSGVSAYNAGVNYISPYNGSVYYITYSNAKQCHEFGNVCVSTDLVRKYCADPISNRTGYCWTNDPDAAGNLNGAPLRATAYVANIYENSDLSYLQGVGCNIFLTLSVSQAGQLTALSQNLSSSNGWSAPQKDGHTPGSGVYSRRGSDCLGELANLKSLPIYPITWKSAYLNNTNFSGLDLCATIDVMPDSGPAIRILNNECKSSTIQDGGNQPPIEQPAICTSTIETNLVEISLNKGDTEQSTVGVNYQCNKSANTSVGVIADSTSNGSAILHVGSNVNTSICVLNPSTQSSCGLSAADDKQSGRYVLNLSTTSDGATSGVYQKSAVVVFSLD